jgi:dephospho-CoA kinase
MANFKVILVSGKARSGKGEFSRLLKEQLELNNKKVVQTLFAKYIKEYAKELGWDGETKDRHWRDFLQHIGTELIQYELNMKEFHVKRIYEDVLILSHYGVDYFIIDDCRFRREVNYMKAMLPDDIITVRVVSNDSRSDLANEQLQHQSEIDLDEYNFDWLVDNSGTLDNLKNEVQLFMNHYKL